MIGTDGAVGAKIEPNADWQGIDVHIGAAVGNGITTKIEVRPIAADFKEINWSAEF